MRILTHCIRRLSAAPAFRIHGKTRRETAWRVLDVFATHRRDFDSRWPLWRNHCITWTGEVIAVGWDFAREVLREQTANPASREKPVEVVGGRIRDHDRRAKAGAEPWPTSSEIVAHEVGHSGQALRFGPVFLPLVGAFTLFREGPHWWNHFENQASEDGQFGGIVNGSVHPELMKRL